MLIGFEAAQLVLITIAKDILHVGITARTAKYRDVWSQNPGVFRLSPRGLRIYQRPEVSAANPRVLEVQKVE